MTKKTERKTGRKNEGGRSSKIKDGEAEEARKLEDKQRE